MPERRFLYLCPHFAPSAATGAIRPARFARCLPRHGWHPVVVTMRNGRGKVVEDVGACDDAPAPTEGPKALAAGSRRRPTTRFSEWLPLGTAVFDQPSLHAAGRRALARHDCRAIVVNAPPVAGVATGLALARRAGLPLILDFRDPWGPCEMRGRRRPLWTRLVEDRVERRAIERAALVILNTETARADYRAAFPQLPKERFRCLRNAADCAGLAGRAVAPFEAFTLLFAGRFRPSVDDTPLWALAQSLWARGVRPDRLRIAVTDDPGFGVAADAPALALFERHARQPQRAMADLMQKSDMLVLFGQPTRQRLPLKFYDYLCSERPVLAVDPAGNDELRRLVAESGMGRVFDPGDVAGMAEYVAGHLATGRHPVQPRDPALRAALSLDRATETLAGFLDEAAGRPRGSDQPR